ncbi:hypothetical protein F2P81_024628 [Scophthalmus maximus]|uniref:Uncharacterized protein n=1 Tax=Scophthalmus maximus TaxID=52904 RepID=A0A6A4RVF1_SCOMX|nr:hypothetical protein F2P81_024628 [Scophthalmus maximus]
MVHPVVLTRVLTLTAPDPIDEIVSIRWKENVVNIFNDLVSEQKTGGRLFLGRDGEDLHSCLSVCVERSSKPFP